MSLITALKTTCIACKTDHLIEVKTNDLKKYKSGAHIQDAFPYLSADEREILVSQICGPCFDKIFAEDDDDEG